MTAWEAQLGLHGEGDDPLAGLQAAAGVAHELEMVRLKGGEAGLLGPEVGQAGAVALPSTALRSAQGGADVRHQQVEQVLGDAVVPEGH